MRPETRKLLMDYKGFTFDEIREMVKKENQEETPIEALGLSNREFQEIIKMNGGKEDGI